MDTAITVRDLVKDYGSVRAVDGVSFEVQQGEVFALLGPNGAGKSTTVEILEGHRQCTSGDVRVLGVDPAAADRDFRDRIGIVLQSSGVDVDLTVREVVAIYGSSYSRKQPAAEVIETVGLMEKADAKVRSLSGGQQRRLDMALGLVGDPDLIFLDEPTTGFDPQARRRNWDLVRRLTAQQRTVVLTTHYLDEAENLADRVAVMSAGRIVASGTPAELRASARSTVIRFLLPEINNPVKDMLMHVSGEIVGRHKHLQITTDTPTADLAHITGWARNRGIELKELTVTTPTLEDVYVDLVTSLDSATQAKNETMNSSQTTDNAHQL